MTDHLTKMSQVSCLSQLCCSLAEALRGLRVACAAAGWLTDPQHVQHMDDAREALAAFDAAQQAAGEQALPPLPNGWVFNHAQQHRDEDGPVDGVWEVGFLDAEDDRFSPIVTVDTGLYYQDKDAEPLAQAILARLTDARAAQAAQPLPLLLRDLCRELGVGVPEACVALREAGLGESSQGSAVTPAMARALRDRFEAQPLPAPADRDERVAVLAAAKAVGLIDWVADDGSYFTFTDDQVISEKLVAFWRHAANAQPKVPQPLPVRDELRFLTRYTPTRDGEMEPWDGGNWLDEGEVRAALTQPAPEAQQASDFEKFLALAEAAGIKSIHDLPGLIPALQATEPPQPAQGVATRQVVPLTKIEFARLWRERMGGSRFNDEHWEAKLITERAHGIGVKLAGGGEGV